MIGADLSCGAGFDALHGLRPICRWYWNTD